MPPAINWLVGVKQGTDVPSTPYVHTVDVLRFEQLHTYIHMCQVGV